MLSDTSTNAMRHYIIVLLWLAIVLPPFYIFIAIQYSAIVFPYFDGVVLASYLNSYYEGTLHWFDLFGVQSQARPFFPRLILITNAIATKWDIRSEYLFLTLSIFACWLLHLYFLRRVSVGLAKLPFLVAAALCSIFFFSPVANTNHWWSVMLLSTLANLCATAAMVIVALNPSAWRSNIIAAVLGWIAAYSLSNGLFVFPVLFVTHQLASATPFRPSRLDRMFAWH